LRGLLLRAGRKGGVKEGNGRVGGEEGKGIEKEGRRGGRGEGALPPQTKILPTPLGLGGYVPHGR